MDDSTLALKCPFRAPVMTRSFACQYAEEITRREGPDIACGSSEANEKCSEFFKQLKTRALDHMGHEDDLTTLPASALQKIQFGGLLGLQSQIDSAAPSDHVENIVELVEKAMLEYGGIEKFPFDSCVDSIVAYKLKRRRDR